MTGLFEPVTAVLAIPALAAALLAALPVYRLTATLNVIATFLTFLAAVALFFGRPSPTPYLLVDDLNNVFIVLTTFVGFTTSHSARVISATSSRSAGSRQGSCASTTPCISC
jgi:hypothetical protein